MNRPSPAGERGNAVAGFVMLAPAVILLGFGLIALASTLYVRTVITDAAAEGARVAAQTSNLAGGEARTVTLIETSVGPEYAEDVHARMLPDGPRGTVEMSVSAPLPLLGFAIPGPALLEAKAHAAVE